MKKIICLFFIKIFIIDFCLADIIILKDGTSIEGEIITDAPDQVRVKTEKKSFFILKENIEKIIIENKNITEEPNWVFIWTASGVIIAFILIFLIARAGNTY